MANTADIKNGLCIEFNKDIYSVIGFQHVKPGKGPAFVRTKLKNIKSGKIIDYTFDAGVKINSTRVERKKFQFTYKDDVGFHFMDCITYDEILIEESLIDGVQFLKEGHEVEILFHTDTETPLRCELPAFVELSVVYTEPGIRGDTATSSFKQAKVETGAVINVPLFIEIDQKIKIDTRTKEYVERAK